MAQKRGYALIAAMRSCRSRDFAKHPLLCAIWLVVAAGAVGCATYTGIDGDEGPDVRVPIDGQTPAEGSSSDTTAPPADTGGNNDTGGFTDTSVVDAPRDATTEDAPPADVSMGDIVRDTSVDPDAGSDVTPPGSDADASADADADADTAVPPGPDTGPDVTAPDVVEAGPRDADATAPPADADGGTVDARDGGPTCWGTPSTHDEDNDGVVDECDNCPSVSNASQADVGEVNMGGSADGVGDACDPRPSAGGDSIFLFDGMNFTTIPAAWTNVGTGTWTASGTSLSPTATVAGQELQRNFPSALGNYLAETTFTFTALTTNGSASLLFRMDGSRNGWGCAVGIIASNGQLLLTQVTAGTGEASPLIAAINPPQVGSRYRLLGGAYSTSVYCMLSTGQRLNRSTTGSTSGESGIRASGASAAFEYLLVYRLGGTVP